MFNAACNTVQSILRGPHLWFQRLPDACAALECVVQEIVPLANAMDIPLSQADIRALDGYFLPYPSDGMCSMAQDLLAKRPTEIRPADRRGSGAWPRLRRGPAGMPVRLSHGQDAGAGQRPSVGGMPMTKQYKEAFSR